MFRNKESKIKMRGQRNTDFGKQNLQEIMINDKRLINERVRACALQLKLIL